ncbi:MAG TPA: alpha-glucosidase [Bacilli bacterium]|nr:alpha-glucosidase [Bacilli bacterium]
MQYKWWHERVFYQIYPRSFADSNNDGVGDIQGIIAKLPYLKSLGIGALWISPLYKSPNYDYGYDISDYYSIHEDFGTLEDFKLLMEKAQEADIKIVMDLVINHTSFKHPRFLQSIDPLSPFHDHYIWAQGKIDKKGRRLPPNNWDSMFTGPAWSYESKNDLWYLHLFTPEQPDLNYHNPAVLEEVKNIMRFWLDLGVAGFRCDVINFIYKSSLDDGQKAVYKTGKEHYLSQEGAHQILEELHRDVLEPYDAYTVGETSDVDLENAKTFTKGNELTMVFPFEHTSVDYRFNLAIFKRKYKPARMVASFKKWILNVDWNPLFLENHDIPRSLSRFGDESNPFVSATALASALLTLKGTPYLYQGQEIGMTNVDFKGIDEIKDVSSINIYEMLQKTYHLPKRLAWRFVNNFTRDHARTPMQWDDNVYAGFSEVKPWLRVNSNYKSINVKHQSESPHSILSHYQKLIALRKAHKVLALGEIKFLKENKNIFVFERSNQREKILVLINMDKRSHRVKTDMDGEVLYANYIDFKDHQKHLRPYEVQIIKK